MGGHTSWWYRTPSSLMEGWVSPSMHQPLTPGILGWGPEQMCTSATRTGLEDKGCTKSENCSTCPQSLSASRRQQEAKMSHIQPNKCQRLKSSTPIPPHPPGSQRTNGIILVLHPKGSLSTTLTRQTGRGFWEAKKWRELPDGVRLALGWVHLSLTHCLILNTSLHSSGFCSLT